MFLFVLLILSGILWAHCIPAWDPPMTSRIGLKKRHFRFVCNAVPAD